MRENHISVRAKSPILEAAVFPEWRQAIKILFAITHYLTKPGNVSTAHTSALLLNQQNSRNMCSKLKRSSPKTPSHRNQRRSYIAIQLVC